MKLEIVAIYDASFYIPITKPTSICCDDPSLSIEFFACCFVMQFLSRENETKSFLNFAFIAEEIIFNVSFKVGFQNYRLRKTAQNKQDV